MTQIEYHDSDNIYRIDPTAITTQIEYHDYWRWLVWDTDLSDGYSTSQIAVMNECIDCTYLLTIPQ